MSPEGTIPVGTKVTPPLRYSLDTSQTLVSENDPRVFAFQPRKFDHGEGFKNPRVDPWEWLGKYLGEF